MKARILGTALFYLWSLSFVYSESTVSFSKEIAPLFITHCTECHNESEQSGDLDLTKQESVRLVVAAGEPTKSELWHQVEDDSMPRKRTPLNEKEKEDLRRWIEEGAHWEGGTIDPFAFTTQNRAGYDWWSVQPIVKPDVPHNAEDKWSRNEVDAFVLKRLHKEGLEPAEEADRRTLLRRLSFDLIGLPPSPEEVDAFVSDPRPDAYERWVDRLLDSPHYGERWARHWLDVIRYGESQGFERNRVRENAWRFRDWVVRALNADMPYDDFVRQQIAGDVMNPDQLDSLIATGYHVVGTWDQVGHLEGSEAMQRVAREDHLEDLVSTLGQAFMGLTIHCARCHDHKFDPITQKEYYQFTAFLSGVHQEPRERSDIVIRTKYDERIAAKRRELADLEHDLRRRHAGGEERGIDGLLRVFDFTKGKGPKELAQGDSTPPWATDEPAEALNSAIKTANELTLEAWVTPTELSQSGPARIVTLSKDGGARNLTLGQEGNRWVVRLRTTTTTENGIEPVEGGKVETRLTHVVYTYVSEGWGRLYVDGIKVAEREIGGDLSNWSINYRLGFGDEFGGGRPWKGSYQRVAFYRRALSETEIRYHTSNPGMRLIPGEPLEESMMRWSEGERDQWQGLKDSIAFLEAAHPHPEFMGTAHVIVSKEPPPVHVLARGNVTQPLEEVAPMGLAALKEPPAILGLAPDAPEADRRRALAQWLTDPRHPLVARVMVNRLWHYHFGKGLVATPSDFGFSGALPSHPQLLDFLATRLVEEGWHLKAIHRLIVTSATYRQSANVFNEKARSLDQEATLLWRYPARRLEGEAIRDAMLALSGSLNRTIGGASFRDIEVESAANDTFGEPLEVFDESTNRRTLYRLWARSGSLPLLEALDCPEPSVMAPQRMRTITPIQALSLLNGSFAGHCAQHLAERVVDEVGYDLSGKVERIFNLVLLRSPDAEERKDSILFASEYGLDQLALVLLNSNEFLFIE